MPTRRYLIAAVSMAIKGLPVLPAVPGAAE